MPISRISGARPIALDAGSIELVEQTTFGAASYPVVVRARQQGVRLIDWAGARKTAIAAWLAQHGAILFRGFALDSAPGLAQLIATLCGAPLPYRERSSPRTRVHENVYTSTEYPPHVPIFFHNENSYQDAWPMKLFFFCEQPAAEGGDTPIADLRRVLARIDPEVRAKFEVLGVLYVRRFSPDVGLSWQTAFQTDSRADLERYCADHDIRVEWLEGDVLRTSQRRRATATHPVTRETVWFNHAAFFHPTTLAAAVGDALVSSHAGQVLPFTALYGDGSDIPMDTAAHLRAAYESECVRWSWQRGDVLLLDNMLVAHGRGRFSGPRRILVGMAEPSAPAGRDAQPAEDTRHGR